MSASDGLVANLAEAILDGSPIDWASAESSADLTERDLLDQLRLIAAVADVHRRPLSGFESAPQSRPPDTGEWGHLRLLERIGQGAFGEVYRAWDTRLDREVALKLLPASAGDGDARATSIIHEGRLLARVHHPNVVTIYGAERIQDRIGLWMEFVKGHTLEQVVQQKKVLSPAETVKIGIELCHAIAAVHGAGLLHRDIKAHNVMLAEDGRVVLMDFGSGRDVDDGPDAALAGTPLYLAPELLSGDVPTVRSDLYSLGLLLYHLLTGSYPVRAASLRDLHLAHERRERTDVKTARPDLPPKLARIIDRAIDPDPGRRYERADALAKDLAALTPRPKIVRLASVLAMAAVLMAIAWIASEIRSRQIANQRTSNTRLAAAGVAPGSSDTVRIVAVNKSPGGKTWPALSPEGSRIAYTWERGGGYELYVQSLGPDASQPPVRITDSANSPAWSPDGRSLAFIRRFPDGKRHAGDGVVVVGARGGTEKLVWTQQGVLIGTGLDWSPDAAALVVSARASPEHPWRLTLITIRGGQARWITTPPASSVGDSYPAYSPDGRSIAFIRDTGSERSLYLLNVGDGGTTRVVAASTDISRPTWTADGQSLIYAAREGAAAGGNSLWRQAISGGEPQRVTGTGEGASNPSTGRRTERVAFVQRRMDQNVYRADLSAPSETIVPLAGTSQQDASPDLSPDGARVAFASDRSGEPEIWTMDIDGSNPRQVTHLRTRAGRPRWSPDGREIAFEARASSSKHTDIFLVNADGGIPRRLTTDVSQETSVSWSADGNWLYYMKFAHGAAEVWKVPAAGGPPRQVTRDNGLKAQESRDGRFLYYSTRGQIIWQVPVGGGDRKMILELPGPTTWGGYWVVSDSGIYWLNVEASPRPAIEFFDFLTARVTRAVTPQGRFDLGSTFSVSRDGRWLFFTQRDYEASDVMMIEAIDR